MKLLIARWLLPAPGDPVDGGGVVFERGRVVRVVASPGARRRAAREVRTVVDLGEGVLTPGLVDAHAHLELSGLAGRIRAGRSFRGWIDRLIAARRAEEPSTLERDARLGAERLLASGTTAVGDIDSTGAAARALAAGPLRVRLYREVLDGGDEARADAAAARLRRALPRRSRLQEGVSPHAPFSVSPALFERVGAIVRRRRLPLAIHWSETCEELEWLRHGRGALSGLSSHSPGRSGLALIAGAGLLGARTALIHGNHPAPGEAATIARAGATVVHCPGSHRFFGRPPFPLSHYRERGVPLALGTDSLASNAALDMRREMAFLRADHPELAPAEVFGMATVAGARALGWGREIGVLQPGRQADACLFGCAPTSAAEVLELLTTQAPAVERVWIGGREVAPVGRAPGPVGRAGTPRGR